MELPPILDASAAAELLLCSVKTVEERLRLGDLPGEKFGDGWAVPTAALLERVNEIAREKMLERRAARSQSARPHLVAVGHGHRRAPPNLGSF